MHKNIVYILTYSPINVKAKPPFKYKKRKRESVISLYILFNFLIKNHNCLYKFQWCQLYTATDPNHQDITHFYTQFSRNPNYH